MDHKTDRPLVSFQAFNAAYATSEIAKDQASTFRRPLILTDRTAHHDFNDDTWEGEPIDNDEVVRSYIREEVIDRRQ